MQHDTGVVSSGGGMAHSFPASVKTNQVRLTAHACLLAGAVDAAPLSSGSDTAAQQAARMVVTRADTRSRSGVSTSTLFIGREI